VKLLLALIFTLKSVCAICSEANYLDIKHKIDKLENTIIQDFSIDYPNIKESMTPKDYAAVASQVEVKFGMQKTLFYKLEAEFYKIKYSIDQKQADKLITADEASRLKNSVDYATRIILTSRRSEINQIYTEFKSSLVHRPELSEIFQNLVKFDVKNCSLSKLKLNQKDGLLSFTIEKKNKFGKLSSSSFVITDQEIKTGQVTSRLDNYNKFNPFRNMITQYWTNDEIDHKSQSFSILQDENGIVRTANFYQESKIPFIDFMGIKLGEQNIKKNFDCISHKMIQGTSPASVSD
jgi:hypothetical protein